MPGRSAKPTRTCRCDHDRRGELSNCPSGQQDGNLGQIGRGETVPEFEHALFRLGASGIVYLPVLLVSVAVMVPAIIVAEKYRRMKGVFVSAVMALVASQIMLFYGSGNVFVLLAGLIVFFSAFNVMEASLPSLITKVAPPDVKGTAMGVYSSLQFLGIFIGGIIGGIEISLLFLG